MNATEDPRPVYLRCGEWLRFRLQFGPVPSATVEKEARALGYGKSALHRAKASVGARSRRIPDRKRGWQIYLPKPDHITVPVTFLPPDRGHGGNTVYYTTVG